MVDGWIKLFRKVLDSGWLRNHKLWVFWSYCLLKASHKDHSQLVGFTQVELRSGQFVFGRKQASIDLNMTQQSIRTCLKNLKKAGNLTIKSTNKYSIVTICNWEFYQNDQLAIQPAKQQASNQQVTSKQPASNQQVTTNKNERMEESKNVNNNISNCPNCNSTKIRIKKKRKGKYEQVIYCEDCKCEFIKENDEIKIIKKGTDFEAIECFDQYYKLHPNSENIFYQKPVALKMFQNLLDRCRTNGKKHKAKEIVLNRLENYFDNEFYEKVNWGIESFTKNFNSFSDQIDISYKEELIL